MKRLKEPLKLSLLGMFPTLPFTRNERHLPNSMQVGVPNERMGNSNCILWFHHLFAKLAAVTAAGDFDHWELPKAGLKRYYISWFHDILQRAKN